MNTPKQDYEWKTNFISWICQKMKDGSAVIRKQFLETLSISSLSKDEQELLHLIQEYPLQTQILLHTILQVHVCGEWDQWFSLEHEVRVLLAEKYGALSESSLNIVKILAKFFTEASDAHAYFAGQRWSELETQLAQLPSEEQIAIKKVQAKFLS